jgi:CRISPR-associated protein Csb1
MDHPYKERRAMSIKILQDAVRENTASAIAVTSALEPVSGHKVLPPTYAGKTGDDASKHNMTKAGSDGLSSWCSLDSPGSCANRVERALVDLGLGLDPLRVDFGGGEVLSTLQLPHRIFDAVLRDSHLNKTRFRETEIGRAVIAATPADASALLRYDPGSLLFGAWDSTGLGAHSRPRTKWARVLTCEISATRVEPVALAGNRLDPIGIEGTDYASVEEEDGTLRQATDDELRPQDKGGLPRASDKGKDANYPRLVKPSQVNHGNALSLTPKGVLVHGEIAFHATLSLSRLRRYRFGDDGATSDGRMLIALMGLYGVLAVLRDGLDLRSGCDLAVEQSRIELVRLGARDSLEVTLDEVERALRAQIAKVDLAEPVAFTPTQGLLEIRRASR